MPHSVLWTIYPLRRIGRRVRSSKLLTVRSEIQALLPHTPLLLVLYFGMLLARARYHLGLLRPPQLLEQFGRR